MFNCVKRKTINKGYINIQWSSCCFYYTCSYLRGGRGESKFAHVATQYLVCIRKILSFTSRDDARCTRTHRRAKSRARTPVHSIRMSREHAPILSDTDALVEPGRRSRPTNGANGVQKNVDLLPWAWTTRARFFWRRGAAKHSACWVASRRSPQLRECAVKRVIARRRWSSLGNVYSMCFSGGLGSLRPRLLCWSNCETDKLLNRPRRRANVRH